MRFVKFILGGLFFGLMSCGSNDSQTTGRDSKNDSLLVKKDSVPPITLEEKIGQMVMIGINKRKSLDSSDYVLIQEIQQGKIGGIILFEKNISDTASFTMLKTLIDTLQASAPNPLFISIDEEGGKVHRLKEKYGFPALQSQQYFGDLGQPDSTFKYVNRMAHTLAELGINLNYAPDIDLATNPDNPVIASLERSYSANPDSVTSQAMASVKAHHQAGVKTVLKHFPGHGSSKSDSHKGMTDVTDYWELQEVFPYFNLIKSGQVDAIMSAHIVNCHLDPNCLPATLSHTIIDGLLRNMLNFNGVVFSDDMQMYAISKHYGTKKAIEMAVNAGVDVLVFGNNVNEKDRITASEVFEMIYELVQEGQISQKRIDESYQRITQLKNKQVI